MIELRKDYILNRWVIISEKRGARPKQFKKIEQKFEGLCYFCPGNEHTTPPEIGRIQKNGKWIIRWFPNKFPALEAKGSPKLKKNGIYHSGNAYGYHEVIAETNDHSKQLSDLPAEHIEKLLNVYVERIKVLSKKKGIEYVLIIKNHGREGGTSLLHTHTQVFAYNQVPNLVSDECNSSIKGKKCLYCDIIKKEKPSKRFIKENKNFIAFCPYASRFNYEAWIFPKKHIKSIVDCNKNELKDLSQIFQEILSKVGKIAESYNFFIHNSPKGKNLHFHIEICPRIAQWGGFELGTETIINSVSPEDAADYYKN